MTAATLSRLPVSAGGSVLGTIGRAGGWFLMQLVELALFALAQFMRAPVAITTVAVLAGLSLLAGSNALFFQTERHPAPLFFSPVKAQLKPAPKPEAPRVVTPVMPAPRPPAIDNETTGSLGPATPTPAVIGNAEVRALQEKLVAMKLLDDTPDGIFGRRTATAIKAFEAQAGLKADGRLTPELLSAVLSAPPAGVASQIAPAALPVTSPAPTHLALSAPTVAAAPIAPVKPIPLAPLSAAAPGAPAPQPVVAAPAAPPVEQAAPAPSIAADTPSPLEIPDAKPTGNLSAAQRLAQQMGTLPPQAGAESATSDIAQAPADPTPAPAPQADLAQINAQPDVDDSNGSTDPALISRIQRGLASLGFLGARIDGVPGEGTAKAIRNFEVFYDYKVTGLATHKLLNLLVQHGAVI